MTCFYTSPRGGISAILLGLFLVLAATGASAQAPSPWTVGGVDVDKTAESAAAARDAALLEGQAAAFRHLIERLVPDSERARVPAIDAARLESMITGVRIDSEKNSQIRYIATLSVDFAGAEVRRFLREAGVAFAATFSKPIVVLPVLRRAGSDLLWSEENIWLRAWTDLPRSYGLVPLIVPELDSELNSIVSADQALNGEQQRIAALANRFGPGGALLVVAAVRADIEAQENVLELVISNFGTGVVAQQTEVRQFRASADTPVESILAQAAAQVRGEISEKWKLTNRISFEQRRLLQASIPLGGLPEWITLRKRLQSISAIDRFDVSALSRRAATIDLYYFGDTAQLRLALAQNNLSLSEQPEGWTIRFDERATAR